MQPQSPMKDNSFPFSSNEVNSYAHNSEIVLPKQDFVKDYDFCPVHYYINKTCGLSVLNKAFYAFWSALNVTRKLM